MYFNSNFNCNLTLKFTINLFPSEIKLVFLDYDERRNKPA